MFCWDIVFEGVFTFLFLLGLVVCSVYCYLSDNGFYFGFCFFLEFLEAYIF